jgi:hypothetical protein
LLSRTIPVPLHKGATHDPHDHRHDHHRCHRRLRRPRPRPWQGLHEHPATILLGIVGSFLGGLLASLLFGGGDGESFLRPAA